MKYVKVRIQPNPGTIFTAEVARILAGQTTDFVDEEQVKHNARIVEASYFDDDGSIEITLEIPEEAATDSLSSTLFLPMGSNINRKKPHNPSLN